MTTIRLAILAAFLLAGCGCDMRPLHIEEQDQLGGQSRSAVAKCVPGYRLRVDTVGQSAVIQCDDADASVSASVMELQVARARVEKSIELVDRRIARVEELNARIEELTRRLNATVDGGAK